MPKEVEENGWANELRPIIGVQVGRIGATVNPIIGYALTGPDAFKPELEPAGKVKIVTDLGFAIGAEYYAGLGLIGEGFSPWRAQDHVLFAAFDLESPPGSSEESPWELNAGIGHGLTSGTAQDWIAKLILGREF